VTGFVEKWDAALAKMAESSRSAGL
jgi:hypothetical protein